MAKYQLLTAATATNSAPSGINAGSVPLPSGYDEAIIVVTSTAGSDTMTVTLKLWGYFDVSGTWAPLGKNSTAASKGLLNDGDAIGETGTDQIDHAELVQGLDGVSRLYLEITAIGGTATAISAYAIPRKSR